MNPAKLGHRELPRAGSMSPSSCGGAPPPLRTLEKSRVRKVGIELVDHSILTEVKGLNCERGLGDEQAGTRRSYGERVWEKDDSLSPAQEKRIQGGV